MKIRQKFKVVRLAALARSMDLSKLSRDQMAYIEERRNGVVEKISYKGWLFRKGWQYYDENTHQVSWPDHL